MMNEIIKTKEILTYLVDEQQKAQSQLDAMAGNTPKDFELACEALITAGDLEHRMVKLDEATRIVRYMCECAGGV